MENVSVVVVGCGRRSYIADSEVLIEAGFRIVAGVEPDADAAAAWSTRHPQAVMYTDVDEALTITSPDVAFITSPDHLHADHACQALAAGCAVYCEKPMATSVEDCDRILATAMSTGSKLYVGHNMRHFPSIGAMKRLIGEGAIGQVQAAWCRHFVSYGGDAYFKDWHAEQRFGTGLLLQKGAHDMDVLHWLCGARTELAVAMGRLSVYDQCETDSGGASDDATWNLGHWPPSTQAGTNPAMDVEDHSMVLMQLANGVQASYLQCHFTPDAHRNYTIIGDAGRIENIGDDDGWQIHVFDSRTDTFGSPDRVIQAEPRLGGDDHGGSDPLILAEFAAFVRHGTPITVSAIASRDAVAVGCAATTSLRQGSQPLQVPPVDPKVERWFEANERGGEAVRP